MKKIKTSLIMLLCVLILCVSISSAYAITYYEYEDFTYFADKTYGFIISEYSGDEKAVTIPATIEGDTVRGIGFAAFKGRSDIEKVYLPDTIYYIFPSAFEGMENIKTITIPKYCKNLSSLSFKDCTNLEEVSFQTNQLISIGDQAFENCINLKSIVIPDGVTKIGSYSFKNCSMLNEITLPDSVTYINPNAFTDSKTVKLICNYNSYAQKFAEDNDLNYELNPLYGDANSDGKVNILDVTAIQRYKIGELDLSDYAVKCADVNKDGSVTIRDATLIQMKLAKYDVDF